MTDGKVSKEKPAPGVSWVHRRPLLDLRSSVAIMEMLCQAASSRSRVLSRNTEPFPGWMLNRWSMSVRRSMEYLQEATRGPVESVCVCVCEWTTHWSGHWLDQSIKYQTIFDIWYTTFEQLCCPFRSFYLLFECLCFVGQQRALCLNSLGGWRCSVLKQVARV